MSDFLPVQDWFNEMHAKNTSKKVRAVFQNKGMSGKPLTTVIPYGYKKNEANPAHWLIDEEAAEVVRKIFRLCVEGYGPTQIANILFRRVFQRQQSIGRHKGERHLYFLLFHINGRQGQLRIFWNGLNTADIRLISVLRHALLKIRPRFTDRKRNGKYLKIPMKPLLTAKHGNLYRSLEATSADQTVQAKSAFFQDYSIVPTAGKNCIIA